MIPKSLSDELEGALGAEFIDHLSLEFNQLIDEHGPGSWRDCPKMEDVFNSLHLSLADDLCDDMMTAYSPLSRRIPITDGGNVVGVHYVAP